MHVPKISVIMPVFNCENYLNESIESILNQTFRDFEFIILNDGSFDKSDEIIKEYQKSDDRIIYFKQESQGITKSLNKCIKKSRGIFIARMDADDICHVDRFSNQLHYLDANPEVDILGCQANTINKSGRIINFIKRPLDDYQIKWDLIFSTPLIHPSLMIRKKIFKNFGYFDESLPFGQDIAYWRKISPMVVFNNLPEKLINYRIPDKLDIIKQGKQRITRMKSNHGYIYNVTKVKIHPIFFTQFTDLFSDGIPHFPIFYPMIATIFRIRIGFIRRYCDQTQKAHYINWRLSNIFLKALSYNQDSLKKQISLAALSLLMNPIMIIKKHYWWGIKSSIGRSYF